MIKCVFCKCRYKKGSKIGFHNFPTDLTTRAQWLQNMKADSWTPKIQDKLCSKHFSEECLEKQFTRTVLKPGSIPTIFAGNFEDQKSFEAFKTADKDNVYIKTDTELQEPPPANITYPHIHDQKYSEEFKTADKDNVYVKIEIEVEEPPPANITYPYTYEMPSSSIPGDITPTRPLSPKLRGVKRTLSERNLPSIQRQNVPKCRVGYDKNDEYDHSQCEEEEKESDGSTSYCTCHKPAAGKMIACGNKNCPIEWYHYGCVGINGKPNGRWFCPTCKI